MGNEADELPQPNEADELRQQTEALTRRLMEERDTLQVMMDNTPEAHLAYLDRDFDFLLVNNTYAEGSGLSKEELIGRNHFELFPNEENERIFKQVRDTGEPAVNKAKPFQYENQPWLGTTYWDWTLSPVKNDAVEVIGVVLSLVDVTEAVRRRDLAEALNELDALVHSTLEFETVMHRLTARAARAAGCESAGVAMKTNDGWVAPFVDEPLKPTAEGRNFSPEEIPVAEMAAAARAAVVYDDVSVDERIAASLEPFGVKSILNVPLFVRDEVVGVLGFHYHTEPVSFSALVIEFAERLADSISLAISNARLYEEEHRVAESLRQALARPIPEVEGLEIGVVYRPAYELQAVGGDFYDIFELDDGRVVVLVGDVSGKGVKAAGLTETVRSTVRTLAYLEPYAAPLLGKLNDILRRQVPPEMFLTAVLAVVDPGSGEVVLADAGHPLPLLCGRGGCEFIEMNTGAILGAFDAEFGETSVRLDEKTLMLYTDGVTEARCDEELYGEERLLETARRHAAEDPHTLVHEVLESITAFGRGRLPDDVAIVALRRS